MDNLFTPESWAFSLYMIAKIKLADMDLVGQNFVDEIESQRTRFRLFLTLSEKRQDFYDGFEKEKKNLQLILILIQVLQLKS